MGSTSRVEVVEIKELLPHFNADKLSLVKIYDGNYTVVINTEMWKGKDRGAFILPDSVVDLSRPEFAFLDKKKEGGTKRITAEKLRGILSEGLLVPVPDDIPIGTDVAEMLGVTRYTHPEQEQKVVNPGRHRGGPPPVRYPAPSNDPPDYDLENYKRYSFLLQDGENVIITEKTEGENIRMTFVDGKFHVSSHYFWKKESPDCHFWNSMRNHPEIMTFLEDNPGVVAYGETYGGVKGFSYGVPQGERRVVLFDFWRKEDGWEDAPCFLEICRMFGLPTAPLLYAGPYSREKVIELTEGDSKLSSVPQIREGVVIKPWKERMDDRIGRVALKSVSSVYLSTKGKKKGSDSNAVLANS